MRPDDHTSSGEVTVFNALRDGLDDTWEAYHSVGLLDDTPDGAKDGELDFVLCHPEQGVLCLEVKGGSIECRHGEWYRDLGGTPTRVQDPFAQVTGHKHKLLNRIDGVDGWRARDLLVGHALVLPDVSVHSLVLGPDAPPEIIIDRRGTAEVATAVGAALAYHRGVRDRRRPPGENGATMLRNLLAPTVTISVPLATAFRDEDAALIELTREQSLGLARMARNRRMAIYGCAGSGKTMLAVEHARRLAEDGHDVLFVCFNRALAAHLHQTTGDERIEFTTFHRLCARLAGRGGVALTEYADGQPPQSFYDDELPTALVEATAVLGPQYDALIVDEAQDLHDDWLAALMCCLREEQDAPVWLFLDDNQRVYEDRLTVPRDLVSWELSTNCRNTQRIHKELLSLYTGATRPDVRGPEGRDPELLHTADQPAQVAAVLDRLLGPDDVPAKDIVVLSSHSRENSRVAQALGERLGDGPGAVHFSSIRAFKGLEAAVVVLCELEDTDAATRDQQLYVGLSRARNHCVIVAPPAAG